MFGKDLKRNLAGRVLALEEWRLDKTLRKDPYRELEARVKTMESVVMGLLQVFNLQAVKYPAQQENIRLVPVPQPELTPEVKDGIIHTGSGDGDNVAAPGPTASGEEW